MNYAILLAGGKGERMGASGVPKQFAEMCGKPMLIYALESAEKNANIAAVHVVCPKNWHAAVNKWLKKYGITKVKRLVEAGKERQQSVHNGLKSLSAKNRDIIIIMTAVCPFLSQKTINKNFELLKTYDACITVVNAVDAITFSTDGIVANRTLQKKKMFVQQGPQTYRYGIIKKAHELYEADPWHEVNEDSEMVLALGFEVAMVLGDRFCVKVTYPEDLAIASVLWKLFEEKENAQNN
jgi:2-C-methyl-D-erythritol 4-phosphate cytidylyltransferase